jgi:hypothetical protein
MEKGEKRKEKAALRRCLSFSLFSFLFSPLPGEGGDPPHRHAARYPSAS